MLLLKKLWSPQIIIPLLLSVGLLTFLLSFADASKVVSEMDIDLPRTAIPVFLLTLLYLLVKGLEWAINLARLGIKARW